SLAISGTINRNNELKDEQMHQRERYAGRFHRSIALPAAVDEENVKASYRNGVLEIRMQKLQPPPKKRINVEFQ
ncbi:MAG: hypothetical protein K0Q59_5090, partial [Paenibacillus sp.]|nr:hypothetical protein [Paenibacillus sp.]